MKNKFGIGILGSLIIVAFIAMACETSESQYEEVGVDDVERKVDLSQFDRAYFASGCFWCVEAIYESVEGVHEVYNGYSGGHTENPTYELSNTGQTGHAEAVEVFYDASVVSFSSLVDVYFGSQNIEQINGQGNDIGSQYRSIIFYQNSEEKDVIDQKINQLIEEGFNVASEVQAFEKFWMGEDYHQDYERLHPNQGYIQAVSVPRLKKFQAKFPNLIKKESKH